MLATVLGKRDFGAPATRAPVVDPGVLHDAEHPRRQVRARAELFEIAQRLLDRHLHEIVGIVQVARQRARKAAQPRQQGNEAFTDFLRVGSHAFMWIIRGGRPVSSMGKISGKLLRILTSALLAGSAQAQLQDMQIPDMPETPVTLPDVQKPGGLISGAAGTADRALRQLAHARALRIEQMSRDNRAELERDPAGELAVRSEVVAVDISVPALQRALENKFLLKRTQELADLGVKISVLQTPGGWTARRGLKELRKLDPEGIYDYNHVYLDGGSAAVPAPAVPESADGARGAGRVGLVDGGVDGGHQVFQNVRLQRFGCGGSVVPNSHGTAVAAILATHVSVDEIFTADVYCGAPAGGAIDAVADALG